MKMTICLETMTARNGSLEEELHIAVTASIEKDLERIPPSRLTESLGLMFGPAWDEVVSSLRTDQEDAAAADDTLWLDGDRLKTVHDTEEGQRVDMPLPKARERVKDLVVRTGDWKESLRTGDVRLEADVLVEGGPS